MSLISVGDLAQSFIQSRQSAAMKSEIQRLSNELTTGVASDAARHLVGDFGPLAGIDASLSRLSAYKSVTAEAGLFTDIMQSALGRIDDLASDLGAALLSGANNGTPSQISALGIEATQKFETAVSALNTRLGDRNLFSGTASGTAPLPNGKALLDTLQSVVAAAVTTSDIEIALDDWFADASGFAATYQGGPSLAGLHVADGEVARVDITAADPSVRDTLKGLAMAALLDRGILANQPVARADLARRSGEALMQGQDARGTLMARLGTAQFQIEQAEQRNLAEASALGIARTELLSVDSYEVASRLQETQTQLETLYALTSRMSRLNLVNFL